MKDESMQGKIAVITGAGRGIGQAIALAYAHAGARVCVAARTDSQLDETVNAIKAAGGQALGIVTDVRDYEAVERLFDRTASAFGGVDIVVAAAGISDEKNTVEESNPTAWADVIDVNLRGTFHTAKAAIPHLKGRGGGKMILIGSGLGHRGAATRSAYAASKAGLAMLVRVLAQELMHDGICVNELNPGPVLTSLTGGRAGPLGGNADVEWTKSPEEVVPLAMFLATQPQRGPTGQTFSLSRRDL